MESWDNSAQQYLDFEPGRNALGYKNIPLIGTSGVSPCSPINIVPRLESHAPYPSGPICTNTLLDFSPPAAYPISPANFPWPSSEFPTIYPYVQLNPLWQYESIAALPVSKQWGTFGTQLEALENAYTVVSEWTVAFESTCEGLDEDPIIDPAGPTFCDLNFEWLLPFFEPVHYKKIDVERRGILKRIQAAIYARGLLLYANDLLQRLLRKLQAVKKILYQMCTRFCGLGWSRRLWFLLHGSHPPKPEYWPTTRQAFGCARG